MARLNITAQIASIFCNHLGKVIPAADALVAVMVDTSLCSVEFIKHNHYINVATLRSLATKVAALESNI